MSTLAGRTLANLAPTNPYRSDEAHATSQADYSAASPCVTILLCTYNGESFLEAQLASLERQSHQNWRLIVSDDGSTDATLYIIEGFASRVAQPVKVRSGPGRGPSANFLSLAADPQIEGDYFAFCDQDDVWYPEKLSMAVGALQAIDSETPAVYGGRTHLVGVDGKHSGYAPLFDKRPNFGNALAQSIAGANTMLFNRATKQLFERTGALDVVSHDWWAYQLVCGSGGKFLYDERPQLDYRQHGNNHIGCNRGWRAQWKRFRMILRGGFQHWNKVNLTALEQCRPYLTDEARAELDAFEAMRSGNLPTRLRLFVKSNVRRQTVLGNVALLIAIVLKKL